MKRYMKLTKASEQDKDDIKSQRDKIVDYYHYKLQSEMVELESNSWERKLNIMLSYIFVKNAFEKMCGCALLHTHTCPPPLCHQTV